MPDSAIFYEWIAFGVRWLHVITAIAWIGSSFYFIALDLGLKPNPKLHKGVRGEEWQVHGGGFYHIQKYMVAPDHMPEHLIWFKWEAYTTWLSGFAMLAIVYYVGADLYLIDRNVMDMSVPLAIFLSVASIAGGWIIYDLLCKSPIGKSDTGLMVLLFGVLVFMAWGYTQMFTGRAALLHLGAFTATIMSANVFFIIIPNQKVIVDDLKAGKEPDPALGKQSKQRSVHNNYLTLPVLFLMLSNHYPLAFATQYNWVIASMIFLIGVLIRHFFNTKHESGKFLGWPWFLSAVLFILIMWLSTNPKISGLTEDKMATLNAAPYMASAQFEEARDTVLGRCSMCHTEEPVWDGVHQAPKNVILDNDQAIAAYAQEIYIQAGRSHAMPPGNVTYMSAEERELLVAWYESVNQ
ncbi:putative membrane protein [Maritalea mobilis]|uniref:Putative membrane protein n=1 Tax=Maritalea mobilis TaxID=483324 RepID=A0A4R6VJV3_9HYPH|nr:urate hydroxylase PuuD [Maritalea mobilis]TDQ61959.1 putative membrane protein [Maritalea mobilis]